MGLFDGLKKSVEDAKAELEAKAKEVQDKLNPVNALKGAFKNPFAKTGTDDEEQQPATYDEEQQPATGDEEQQPVAAASGAADCEGNANNLYNAEDALRKVLAVLEMIPLESNMSEITLQDIIARIRQGTPFESKSTEGDFRKVLGSNVDDTIIPLKGCWYNYVKKCYDATKTPNASVEDAVAYITENFDEAMEKYYQRYPSKRPASAKPAREANADKLFDYPSVLNALNAIKAELDKHASDLSKDDIAAAFRRGTSEEGKGTGDFKKAMMNPVFNTTIANIKQSVKKMETSEDITIGDLIAYIEENF